MQAPSVQDFVFFFIGIRCAIPVTCVQNPRALANVIVVIVLNNRTDGLCCCFLGLFEGHDDANERLSPKNPLIGVGWMITAGLLFVGVTALVKLAGTRIPAAESAFLRYVLGLVFLIPMIPAMRRSGGLNGRVRKFFAFRGVWKSAQSR